jgi:hypothetical protein
MIFDLEIQSIHHYAFWYYNPAALEYNIFIWDGRLRRPSHMKIQSLQPISLNLNSGNLSVKYFR